MVGLGTYSREMAREVRAAASKLGLEALITDDHLAVDPHPAARDPFIGFAARAQAQFGHSFGEAERFGHGQSFSVKE